MSRNQRILVAEDDPGVRDLIRARLTNAGYDTHTAHNGREAVERMRSLKPDGMVLDINMPELDGFGVLEVLRADEALLARVARLLRAPMAGPGGDRGSWQAGNLTTSASP
jgi:CheY-like chemotaxis protein